MRGLKEVGLEGDWSEASRGMEREALVPRANGAILRDCRADTVHASISTEEVEVVACGCWDGGGTEE